MNTFNAPGQELRNNITKESSELGYHPEHKKNFIRLAKGEVISSADYPSRLIFVCDGYLLQGRKGYKKNLGLLFPGDLLIMPEASQLCMATAESNCTLFVTLVHLYDDNIDSDILKQLWTHFVMWGDEIGNRNMVTNTSSSVHDKLIYLLDRCCKKDFEWRTGQRDEIPDGYTCKIPLGVSGIARAASVSRSQATKKLKKLQDMGIIDWTYGKLEILKPAAIMDEFNRIFPLHVDAD
ncbi:MAG: hypothetical protein RPU64_03320 [Candidatus Sedimenticola sp. (ex Thyasira tokunagai)]